MILSLDTSIAHCGYALWLHYKPYKVGELNDKSKNPTDRLTALYLSILSLINDYDVDTIVFEDTNTLLNVQTLKSLCRLQGLIISICITKHIPYYTYLPTQWRKILAFRTGERTNRIIQKELAIEYVDFTYNIQTRNDNIAEAICIGSAFIKEKGVK